MSDTTTEPPTRRTEIDGHPIGFWVTIGTVIAVVTLGLGVWWVWGLGQDMPMGDDMDDDMVMDDMPHTDVRLPPVAGFYAGREIFFVHPEASDDQVAEMLTDMMAGSPVLVVPELAEAPAAARDDVFVFTNGIEGMGPFGHQPDVFPSAPGDADYSPLRTVVLVTWHYEEAARELNSAEQVQEAADADEVTLEETDVVVNMPFLTWPQGAR